MGEPDEEHAVILSGQGAGHLIAAPWTQRCCQGLRTQHKRQAGVECSCVSARACLELGFGLTPALTAWAGPP